MSNHHWNIQFKVSHIPFPQLSFHPLRRTMPHEYIKDLILHCIMLLENTFATEMNEKWGFDLI